jgi:GPH family glycoside/pentoside/hexuronide:cation symporter
MSHATHHETAPEDRLSLAHKLIYGFGAFVNNLLAAAIGGMVIVLNLGLGMNPALVGLVGALPRVTDAITDPLMGYVSDHTRSKWGRRRPYIFFGAIAAGIIFALLWQLPEGKSESFYFWVFLAGSIVFYLAYTVFATPWVALGYELTPDYHERTRLMGVQNILGQMAYLLSPWFLWFMALEPLHDSLLDGAGTLAIMIGATVVVVGVLPAIFLKERFKESSTPVSEDVVKAGGQQVEAQTLFGAFRKNMRSFFRGFAITLKFKPFLKLCAATFLVFNGFIMIASFQFYVIIYYVFGGDQEQGALYAGWSGTLSAVSTFLVIIIVTKMATKIGKRRAFFVSTAIAMLGYALKWVCYRPDMPLLLLVPAPLMAFGLGGLFTLMGSMIADVCDLDELETHERREGMYASIYWWVVKLGQAAAIAVGGVLLNVTGFDVAFGGDQTAQAIFLMRIFDAAIPVLTSALAIWAIYSYSMTEERAYEVREELERRRGKAGA